jgi:mannose-6-phosphate isomerase-like protein (cupin superfamily)
MKEVPAGTNYVTRLEQMKKVEAGHGETVYQMEGRDYNLDDLSLVIAETQPGGGPDLHWHTADEVHVVLKGTVTYIIGDSVFTVTGRSVINVPARVPHTFINAGDSVLNLVAFFSQDSYGGYHPLGPNPLIEVER